jgi:hypothetical protein
MKRTSLQCVGMLGLPVCLLFSHTILAIDPEAPLDSRQRLRNEIAKHYMNPESHLKLARYHYDQGHKEQAFYLAEYARSTFGDEAFEPSFKKIAAIKMQEGPLFDDEETEKKYCQTHPTSLVAQWREIRTNLNQTIEHDLPILETARKTHPTLSQLDLWHFYLLLSAGRTNEADQVLISTLERFPKDLDVTAMAAKYFLKTRHDDQRAMQLYIDLYFYNPHYYDWEYAEFRVKNISASTKEKAWQEKMKSGKPLRQLINEEHNPRLLDVAIDEARTKWDPSWGPILLDLLNNDDPSVQSRALHTLLDHPEAFPDSETIQRLLQDPDLIKRSMAAFLAVKGLGPDQYSLLQANLDSDIELVQLDTMQALVLMGGETGLAYLKAHPPAKASEEIMKLYKNLSSSNNLKQAE